MPITTAGMDAALVLLDSTVYLGVHTGDPGATGSSNELAGTRPAVTFGAATTGGGGRQRANTNSITFPTPGAGTYTHWSVWTAATGGTCRWTLPFTADRTLTSVDDLRADVGAVVCRVLPSA
jgi:hypothetical protein